MVFSCDLGYIMTRYYFLGDNSDFEKRSIRLLIIVGNFLAHLGYRRSGYDLNLTD